MRRTSTPDGMPSFLARRAIAVAAGGLLAALAVVAGFSDLPYEHWIFSLVALAVGGGLATAAAAFLRPTEDPRRIWIALVFVLAIAFRLGAMASDRMVCTDAARYVWDGKVYASGISPYDYAPRAGELDFLRTDALDRQVNTAQVRTPYPPLAEVVFLASYALTPGRLTGYQTISLTLEIAAWFLLLALLGRLGLPRGRILFVAWAPLLVIEGYLPGHSDVLALPLLCLLIGSALDRRPVAGGLVLAAAFLIKPIAVFLIPATLREMGRRRAWILLAVFAVTVIAVYVPMALWGRSHFPSMLRMALHWSFGGTVVPLLSSVMPGEIARAVALAATVVLVVVATEVGRDFVSRCLLSMAAVFALSPVVFPWYVVWVVPFLVLRPDPAMIALAVLAVVTDVVAVNVYVRGRLEADLWPTLTAFVPFYALLALGRWRRWGMFAPAVDDVPGDEDTPGAPAGAGREPQEIRS